MRINAHLRGFRSLVVVLCVVALFGGMLFVQSCGTSGDTADNHDIDDDGDIDYRAKAQDLVDRMYAASSADEIEPILKEVFTIIGVPVYNHENTAIVKGSGTLDDGVALRDYHIFVLADSFFKYRLNPNRHTTAKVFAAGVQNLGGENGPVSLRFEAGDTEQEFDESMVLYLAMLYKQVSMVWGTTRPLLSGGSVYGPGRKDSQTRIHGQLLPGSASGVSDETRLVQQTPQPGGVYRFHLSGRPAAGAGPEFLPGRSGSNVC